MASKPQTRINTSAIREAHPLPTIAGAVIKLYRSGQELKGCCPFHPDRSPSFTIYAGGTRFKCFGCGASGDVLDFVRRIHGVDFVEAAALLAGGKLPSLELAAPAPAANETDRVADALAIWRAARPIQGTLAETYLRSRGLHLPLPDSLRYAELSYGKRGRVRPTLVAAIASHDNHVVGIQRTFLNDDGTGKADVPKPKLSLGRVSGCAIRLAPCAVRMTVTEGLEDGLTLQQEYGHAVWVACGADMLSRMIFPAGVRRVLVGGDGDKTGEQAAHRAVEEFRGRGIVSRAFFPIDAKDFNQELMEGGRP